MADFDETVFVFRDKGGKRWPRLRRFLLAVSLFFFLGAIFFVRYLITTPLLQRPVEVQQLRSHLRSGVRIPDNPAGFTASPPLWLRFSKSREPLQTSVPAKGVPAGRPDHDSAQREVRLGFYVDWDPDSYQSLLAHAGELTHVSPEWLTVIDGEGNIKVHSDQKLLDAAEDHQLVVLPLLSNLVGNTWEPEAVEGLINGPQKRQDRFITALLQHLDEAEAGGVLIDWNQIDPTYRQSLTIFLSRLSAALHEQKMQLWLCIPMGLELKAFDLEALASVADRFVAMLHDENSESDQPGPIASQPWFEGWLQTMLGYGQPAQWIAAVGSYGYDWAKGQQEADAISFVDAMSQAGRAGLQDCRSEAPAYNPHFYYMDGDTEHEVWFLDGITFLNQIQVSRRLQTGGIAVSRLGTEDPAIWQALSPIPSTQVATPALNPLQTIAATNTVAQVGKGNFLTIEDNQAKGYREIAFDSSGYATTAYRVFPSYRTIVHQGRGKTAEVAISFDDGPDPDWTPAILDILKARGVKASFFMVGERMEEHPELVERVLREGHDIGIHTYTHPNLAEVSAERAHLELNATQRLMETITGHSTFLFRPPYNADSQPHSPAEIAPLQTAQNLGYLTVASDIDPEDWSRPGAAAIIERVKEQRPGGNIILLHDAGGNRSQTIESLPLIIDYLETRGDRIVSLDRLLGTPASLFMPPVPKNEQSVLRLIGNSGFRFLHVFEELCRAFLIVATVLITLRTLLVALFSQVNRGRSAALPKDGKIFQPPITIVVAAYNEEKVIGRTLEALQQGDYPGNMEIVVVDDGSTDRTAALVEEISAHDSRIHLLRQKNLGKAGALRRGFQAATQEIIVTLDADTIFQPDTIRLLVQSMQDQKVGAVSGRVQVGNQQSVVARFQALEYTCGFNLDRRAYHQLNCITVVPGAASVWRKSAVMAAGGISSDTLAEDTDLTLSLHRAGYQVGYAPTAVAWTEAPETYAALLKQRSRWAFGTMQCLWKHRDLVGNPRYKALGWFSLPSIWFFQILLVAVGPVLDGFLLFSLFFGLGFTILFYLLIFLAMDLLLAGLACRMEGESLRPAWRILPMRFIYRPLLAWVVWKSIIRAAKGALVGWGKLERSASIIKT